MGEGVKGKNENLLTRARARGRRSQRCKGGVLGLRRAVAQTRADKRKTEVFVRQPQEDKGRFQFCIKHRITVFFRRIVRCANRMRDVACTGGNKVVILCKLSARNAAPATGARFGPFVHSYLFPHDPNRPLVVRPRFAPCVLLFSLGQCTGNHGFAQRRLLLREKRTNRRK